MQRPRSLFGDEDHSTEAYVISRLEPLYPLLWQAIAIPFYDLRGRIARNDSLFVKMPTDGFAKVMHHGIAQAAERIVRDAELPGVRFVPPKCGTKQMMQIVVEGSADDLPIGVSLKKLCQTEDVLLRSNFQTPHQRDYWSEGRHLIDDGLSVIFGYVLEKANTEFSTWLTYPVGDQRNAWVQKVPGQEDVLERIRAEREAAAEVERRRAQGKGYRLNAKDRERRAEEPKRRAEGAG